jgi:uncharacterized protein YbjT (DUF2867 family)
MIVVTTPTGSIGSQVLEKLLESGESVRVIVRDASRIPEQTRERIEIVEGSHGDLEVVNKAFQGADSVFWLVPPDPRATDVNTAYVGFTRPACEAIKAQGVKHVVGVSALGRGWTKNAGLVTASLAMDDMIASTGVNYRALTMPSFMENLLNQAGPIKGQGMFFSPLVADRKFPTCASRDIADAAVKLLLDPSWTGHGSVAVLGPEDLSFNEMARIMSDVLGKSIGFKQIPMEAFKGRLAGFGMSEAMVQGYLDMMTAKNEGLDNMVLRTPESTTPTSFRQWCEETLKPAILA